MKSVSAAIRGIQQGFKTVGNLSWSVSQQTFSENEKQLCYEQFPSITSYDCERIVLS